MPGHRKGGHGDIPGAGPPWDTSSFVPCALLGWVTPCAGRGPEPRSPAWGHPQLQATELLPSLWDSDVQTWGQITNQAVVPSGSGLPPMQQSEPYTKEHEL